ncbi:hypothetical protein [Neisseria musculi]|nr:hypothetical protein [Neisseria musculi]
MRPLQTGFNQTRLSVYPRLSENPNTRPTSTTGKLQAVLNPFQTA